METNPEQFPPDRRADPRRRAEVRVFDAIRASDQRGIAIYEWQRNPDSPQLDFAIWTLGGGRFGLQVKGGTHSLKNGKWHLETKDGREEKPSPLRLTWDAAMSLREDIVHTLEDPCCFIVAVLLFPDMEPDPAIVAEARRSNVHILWGTDNLMDRLAAIAARKVYYPPNADDIHGEVAAVTDQQILYAEEVQDQGHREERLFLPAQPGAPRAPRLETPAGGITIGHVDTLIVHTAPGSMPDAGRNPELRTSPGSGTPHGHGRSYSRDGRPWPCQPGKQPTAVSRTALTAPRSPNPTRPPFEPGDPFTPNIRGALALYRPPPWT